MSKNNIIKFKHNYTNLYGQITGILLGVEQTSSIELNTEFVDYATNYYDGNEKLYADLPNGLKLRLVFLGNKGIPFAVIKKASEKALNSYRKRLNDVFAFVVEDDND